MAVNTKRVFYVRAVAHKSFMDVLSTRPDVRLDKLENDSPEAMVAPVLADAHIYQIGASRDELNPKLWANDALLARTSNLLVVSSTGAGYDTVDVDACTKAGVLVVNQSGGNAESVAQHALAMLLALTKRIIETDRYMRRQSGIERNAFMGMEALGKTVGIIGIGNVGTRLAEMCSGLFRMRVLAYDPYLTAEEIAARGAEKVELDELLRNADYVSINCPLTETSRGLMGEAQFALMQPHAYFITTARGFIHDEDALLAALRAKKIAGAGLDVWSKEPPPHDHPLMQFDNVLVSPHTAGVTKEARINMGKIAAEQILTALDGKRPPRVVNPEVWPVYAQRFEKTFGFAPG
jgi:D-3-phosphoglycerate dehydrogenase / 2-oxoglutarate reductase